MEKEELKKSFDTYSPILVIEEAARCLLCHDAPCSKACPAETDPARFIRAVRFRNFKGAAEVIRENNALGGICARICPTESLCKSACSRCGIDRPIEIGKIQQYVTDYEQKCDMKILKVKEENTGKIAIVGSGPAGLEAAAVLRSLGYAVTIYEKRENPGGWMTYGIPKYRLPQAVVNNEIQKIADMGVKFILNCQIGRDMTFDELKKEYDCVLLAVGLSEGRNLEIFHGKPNVEIAANFLARQAQAQSPLNSKDISVIIGGGDVAMDVASTLKFGGVEDVICIARETAEEFLASQKELKLARNLAISIYDGYTPISYENNILEFKHTKMDSILKLKADKVYLAVGQISNLSGLEVDNNRGQIVTTEYQTSDPKVFACGDVIEGEKIAVQAIRLGKEAALKIHEFLGGKKHA